MNEENTVKIIKYGIVGVVVLLMSVIASCQVTNFQIASAIEAGTDPMDAKCALRSDGATACLLRYAQP